MYLHSRSLLLLLRGRWLELSRLPSWQSRVDKLTLFGGYSTPSIGAGACYTSWTGRGMVPKMFWDLCRGHLKPMSLHKLPPRASRLALLEQRFNNTCITANFWHSWRSLAISRDWVSSEPMMCLTRPCFIGLLFRLCFSLLYLAFIYTLAFHIEFWLASIALWTLFAWILN